MSGVFSLANTLSGMDANTLQQAALESMFQKREQQINAMPPPQPMAVPPPANPLLMALAALAGSAGTALSHQNNFVPSTMQAIQGRMAAPAMAQQANREAQVEFESGRTKQLQDLAMKRLDTQIAFLRDNNKNDLALELQRFKNEFTRDLEMQKQIGRLEAIGAKGEEARRTKAVPNVNVTKRTVDVTGIPSGGNKVSVGGVGGSGPKGRTEEQRQKELLYKQDYTAGYNMLKERLKGAKGDQKKIAKLRSEWDMYVKDLRKEYGLTGEAPLLPTEQNYFPSRKAGRVKR